MNSEEYRRRDGIGLAKLLAKGEVSRAELRAAAIHEIEAQNPGLNAVIREGFDQPETPAPGAPLDGVPFLLKDANLYSEGMTTSFGSRYFRSSPPKGDSHMVARWRAAGLQILGKTNTPEFAAEFVTEPRAFGPTHNPVLPGHTVGGSSGGAAAAVAAGMVPLAHATDLGGSIRIPAACCGLFGLKPSAGLNPVGPWFDEIASGLNSDHVLTRSTRDSAASLDITAPGPRPDYWLAESRIPPRRLRIGMAPLTPGGIAVDPDQREGMEAAEKLLRDLGHEMVSYDWPPGLEVGPWFDQLWIRDIAPLLEARQEECGRPPEGDELEELTLALLAAARAAGPGAAARAREEKTRWSAAWLASWSGLDLLLTPALQTAPPRTGALAYRRFQDLEAWNTAGYGFAPFAIPANISGVPSAVCPFFARPGGLPAMFQLTARPGADLLLLQVARQMEEACAIPDAD